MISTFRTSDFQISGSAISSHKNIHLDGKHFYSTMPENSHKKVLVGIRAHAIDILTQGGQLVTTHRRAFGEGRTDISDYSTTLAVLLKNSGAWENSGLRRDTPDALRAYMDAQPREKLKDCLRIMDELTNQYGFDAAVSAMEMACSRGNINICDASVRADSCSSPAVSRKCAGRKEPRNSWNSCWNS